MKQTGLGLLFMGLMSTALAGQVEVQHAEFEQRGGSWTVAVTLKHADTGWDHYADGWRVVTPDGKVLGHRTLYHPHENEQPFTRNLGGIQIPAGVQTVFVEGHDKVHGWSPDRIEVNLQQPQGKRYRIRR